MLRFLSTRVAGFLCGSVLGTFTGIVGFAQKAYYALSGRHTIIKLIGASLGALAGLGFGALYSMYRGARFGLIAGITGPLLQTSENSLQHQTSDSLPSTLQRKPISAEPIPIRNTSSGYQFSPVASPHSLLAGHLKDKAASPPHDTYPFSADSNQSYLKFSLDEDDLSPDIRVSPLFKGADFQKEILRERTPPIDIPRKKRITSFQEGEGTLGSVDDNPSPLCSPTSLP